MRRANRQDLARLKALEGAACAGVMGPAYLRICPYVDVVVCVEGELVLADLYRRLERSAEAAATSDVHWPANKGQSMASAVTTPNICHAL